MDKTVSIKLKEIIRDSGWTQEELARRLNVPLKTVNFWINERSNPRTGYAEKINELHTTIVGNNAIDDTHLAKAKLLATSTHLNVDELLSNKELLDKITLHLTYHTNTIEGSTMTVQDVQQILDDDNAVLSNRTAREQIEARNHRSALYFLLDTLKQHKSDFQWSTQLILDTHLRLMNGITYDAGAFRRYGVRIMGSRVATANPLSVPDRIEQVVTALNYATDDLIAQLAATHAKFEQTHPFSDGNGRTGRLIMFIQALRYEQMPPLVLKERKRAYYKYLELAQCDDNSKPLELFIAESISTTDNLLGMQ